MASCMSRSRLARLPASCPGASICACTGRLRPIVGSARTCDTSSGSTPFGRPPRQVLDPVLGVVGGDAQQPGRELRLAPEALDGLEHGDEHVLRDVLRLLAVAEHPVDQAEDLVAVLADDLAECLLVALDQASDQEPLGQAHRVGRPLPERAGAGAGEPLGRRRALRLGLRDRRRVRDPPAQCGLHICLGQRRRS